MARFRLRFHRVVTLSQTGNSVQSSPIGRHVFNYVFTAIASSDPVDRAVVVFIMMNRFDLPRVDNPYVFLTFPNRRRVVLTNVRMLLSRLISVMRVFRTSQIRQGFLAMFFAVVRQVLSGDVVFRLFVFYSVHRVSIGGRIPTGYHHYYSSRARANSFSYVTASYHIRKPRLGFAFRQILVHQSVTKRRS